MAAEQDRKFREHQNSLFGENGREDGGWNGMGMGNGNGSGGLGSGSTAGGGGNGHKRRISEVSDSESQPTLTRPPPPLIGPLYDVEQTPQITDMGPYAQGNAHQNGAASQDDRKRRPDPNDDTIGSDLDDSDDEGEIDSENEDEDMPLMLCSYEKVHRTKNKWRANLSNGVVCINGREWVFEKGNGEYEW
jgi:transcription initiation factor TFIIA large subunit